MARTVLTGFAALDPRVDLNLAASLPSGASYDTSIKRTGPASLKIVAASGANAVVNSTFSGPNFHRCYLRVTARPATTRRIVLGNSGVTNIRLNPDGTLAIYSGSTARGTSTTALTDTTHWYRVEYRTQDGTDVPTLLIDGNVEVTGSPSSWGSSVAFGPDDTVADTYTVYFADFCGDDAALPGEGAVVLLLPISDNARAALWVAGSNATTATTNLWEGVNNTPPVGTATSIPVANGISHEGGAGGSTDDYDANMTSYSSAGIAAGSTINAVRAISVTGEDIATGAKLLTMSVKSNPAQGAFETNWTVGTGAVGAYPTNWTLHFGTIITSPSVTLGTSPVMTVRRPETASRRADVCFMGMYVDYTPPAGATASPGTGALSLAGFAPVIALAINTAVGALGLTGFAPTVQIGTVVQTDVGAATLAGFAPAVTATNNVTVDTQTGALSLNGVAPQVDYRINTAAGQLDLAGFAPTVTASDHQTASPAVGALTLAGFSPSVVLGTNVATDLGQLNLTGFSPTVTASDHQTVTTGLGELSLTGFAPALDSGIQTAAGQLVLSGFAPTVQGGVGAAPDTGALTLSGFAPTVTSTANVTASPGVGALSLAGFAPTVTASDHQTALTGTGALSLAGFAPSIFAGTTVDTATGQLALAGFAPTVSVTQHQTAEPGVGLLQLAGFAPVVSASDHQTVGTQTGQLQLAGFEPSAVSDNRLEPATGQLSLTGFEPTVSATANVTAETQTGALALTGFEPAIQTTGQTQADPALGQLTLTGFAPTILLRSPYRFDDTEAPVLVGSGAPWRFGG